VWGLLCLVLVVAVLLYRRNRRHAETGGSDTRTRMARPVFIVLVVLGMIAWLFVNSPE
jgi:hypothetical protein